MWILSALYFGLKPLTVMYQLLKGTPVIKKTHLKPKALKAPLNSYTKYSKGVLMALQLRSIH